MWHHLKNSNKTKPVSSTLQTVVVKLDLISDAICQIVIDFSREFYK